MCCRLSGGERAYEGTFFGTTPSESAAVGAKSLPSRNETLTFVREHSPQGDADLLPGLCLFAERWLSKVFAMAHVELTRQLSCSFYGCLGQFVPLY